MNVETKLRRLSIVCAVFLVGLMMYSVFVGDSYDSMRSPIFLMAMFEVAIALNVRRHLMGKKKDYLIVMVVYLLLFVYMAVKYFGQIFLDSIIYIVFLVLYIPCLVYRWTFYKKINFLE